MGHSQFRTSVVIQFNILDMYLERSLEMSRHFNDNTLKQNGNI